jgi:hypothetical protein
MMDPSLIAEKIQALEHLGKKPVILIDEVDAHFRPDLQTFIIGETLTIFNGKPSISANLFKKWLYKINIDGFDYEIDIKQ